MRARPLAAMGGRHQTHAMALRTNLETWALRNQRGPRLLGARRHTHRDARGRVTPYLELGNDVDGTLVFIHGFSDRPEHFFGTAALLRSRYRILIPAVPAFGDGFVDSDATHHLDAFADWMTTIVEGIAPARFHLMGNSLGGAASLGITSRIPHRIESLTLVDTAGVKPAGVSCVFDSFGEGTNPFEVRSRADYAAFASKIAAKPNPALATFANALYREARSNADWYAHIGKHLAKDVEKFYLDGRDAFVDLRAIRTPTLVVWGTEDALLPTAIGEHIAREIPGAELQRLHGVGHCPHLEAPKQLADAFARFASAHGPRARPKS